MRSISEGTLAPDFDLPDTRGRRVRLSELRSTGPVVLFFYPAAMTPGCTEEARHFRDLSPDFKELGAHRVGISSDPVESQCEFSEVHGFDYPLLSDTDGAVATRYGTQRGGVLSTVSPTKRETFVIDTDATILSVIRSEVRMRRHAEEALRVLRDRAA